MILYKPSQFIFIIQKDNMMRVVEQSSKLPIENFDMYTTHTESCNKHGPLLPSTIRCLITGPSNSGKTNAVFNILFDPNGLRFENVYIFSKSLNQPKYQFLKKVLPKEIGCYMFDENTQVFALKDTKPNSIMIFDDVMCEKHDNIRNYFCMGRHNNIDSFYIGQTYSRIPKQLVRDNTNLIILFKQDGMNLRHVYNDHVTTDMSFEQFKEMCSLAWKENYSFFVINKDCDIDKGRYRVGFDKFIQL